MKAKTQASLLLGFVFIVGFNGCAFLAVGAAGAAGGYAVSPDGIEGVSDKSYDHLWSVAKDVLEQQGTITLADKKLGQMKAKIKNSEVQFKMEQATHHSVVMRVQARRMGGVFPDMNAARRIYSMIAHEHAETKEL